MVSATTDAPGGGMRAYAIDLLWHSWFCEELKAGMGPVCVRSIATYAAALGVGLAPRAASSRVAKSPAEAALSGGGG